MAHAASARPAMYLSVVKRLRLPQPATRKRVVEIVWEGPFARWMAGMGWGAFTLPLPFVVVISYWLKAPPRVRVHEFVHVQQDERCALFLVFWIKYLAELVRHSYRDSKYEIEACAVEAATKESGLPHWARPLTVVD
jgi:hypothetical protein